jgi:hypothetical protein
LPRSFTTLPASALPSRKSAHCCITGLLRSGSIVGLLDGAAELVGEALLGHLTVDAVIAAP